MSEQVLVVPRSAFFDGQWPQGLVPAAARRIAAFEAAARFMDRDLAEEDPSHKQLIPYCAVMRNGEIFCVERLPTQGEARLHGKRSVGFGGHVGPEDGPAHGAVERGLWRELHEELVLPEELGPQPKGGPGVGGQTRFLGLLNDDSNAVGRVHLGLVYCLEVPEGTQVGVRETLKMRGRFCDLGTLAGESGLGGADPTRAAPVAETAKLWQHQGLAPSMIADHDSKRP